MKLKKKTIVRISIALFLIVIISIYLSVQNNWIKEENIDVLIEDLPGALEGLTIAHLSDLHFPKNASSIENIIEKVKKANPDLIVITGDIIDEHYAREDGLDEFLDGIKDIAPIYAVFGNHEIMSGYDTEVEEVYEEFGIRVLRNEYAIFTYNGADVLIIGMNEGAEYNSDAFFGIEDFKDVPSIMLAHHPELQYSYSSENNEVIPDLVFSGHAHGGQVRLPFIGGLLSPNQGFLPSYDSGLYQLDNGCQMVVSRGLGNSIFPFRVNNRPHMPVIKLIVNNE